MTGKVLKFSSHSLAIFVYGGISNVDIDYAGTRHSFATDDVMPDKKPEDENRDPGVISGSYVTFAGPLSVRWTARDGSKLEASIDLDPIFPDRAVLHKQDPQRIHWPDPFVVDEPVILVEVNDRTIEIYMLVTLRLDNPEGPNPFKVTDDRTLAFSRSY